MTDQPSDKNHTPASVMFLVGLLLAVLAAGYALLTGSWRVLGAAAVGLVAWLIACVILDVIVNRNRT